MKKFIFLLVSFAVFAAVCAAQKTQVPPIKLVKPQPVQTPVEAEVSGADWQNLTDVLQAEKWTEALAIAARMIKNLPAENDKKQLARLRYVYLYALAGEIITFHDAKLSVEEDGAWVKLDEAASEFAGKEFVLPPHQFLPDCKEALNFICPVKDNDKAVRVAATNKEGNAALSFDYVFFDQKFSFNDFSGSKIFLGGKLKRAEFNQDLSKPWVMRLIFEKGFATVIASK